MNSVETREREREEVEGRMSSILSSTVSGCIIACWRPILLLASVLVSDVLFLLLLFFVCWSVVGLTSTMP